MKAFNNLNDIEKEIIHEYDSWKMSMCDPAYKLSMLECWMSRAQSEGISHLLNKA